MKLAERAQNDHRQVIYIAGKAVAGTPDIHEGFVDDQKPAPRLQLAGNREKFRTFENAPVGIVGVHNNGDVSGGQWCQIIDFYAFMAAHCRAAGVLGIG